MGKVRVCDLCGQMMTSPHRKIIRVLDLTDDQPANMARTTHSLDMHEKCTNEMLDWIKEQFNFNTQETK